MHVRFSARQFATLGIVIIGGAIVWAQEQNPLGSGSLAALTEEVHQLRLAVQESTRAQTQTQATAVYLSVEKDRILQIQNRLDATRKDADAALQKTRQGPNELAHLQAIAASDPQVANQVAAQIRDMQQQVPIAKAKSDELQLQVSDLTRQLQDEEARWTELTQRLEQEIRR